MVLLRPAYCNWPAGVSVTLVERSPSRDWHTCCYGTYACRFWSGEWREVIRMTEKPTQLPSSEEILAAYEQLFGKDKRGVEQYQKSGVHYVNLPHGTVL